MCRVNGTTNDRVLSVTQLCLEWCLQNVRIVGNAVGSAGDLMTSLVRPCHGGKWPSDRNKHMSPNGGTRAKKIVTALTDLKSTSVCGIYFCLSACIRLLLLKTKCRNRCVYVDAVLANTSLSHQGREPGTDVVTSHAISWNHIYDIQTMRPFHFHP